MGELTAVIRSDRGDSMRWQAFEHSVLGLKCVRRRERVDPVDGIHRCLLG